jgi:uncharacterized protein (TIGR00369 family)
MTSFTPGVENYRERTEQSFARQGALRLLGADLGRVAPGYCEIVLPYRADLTQQHGYFHAGITTTIADTAGGYAGYTLFPPDSEVVAVEFKVNLLSPAVGDRLIACAQVLRAGRNLTTTEVEVFAESADGTRKRCAKMLQTLARVAAPEGG